MCDYSLEMYRSRPAQAGETYETFRFPSGTVGFTAPGDTSTAVCMACDTRLRLEGIPETVRSAYGVAAEEDVTFARLEAGPHHDGVRFANGAQVTLQLLGPTVKARVLDTLTTPAWEKQTEDAI